MSHLQGYWDTAKSTNTYWEERDLSGQKLAIATFPWPPKELGKEQQLRHIVFVLDSTNHPIRSLSYEPNTGGPGVFFGEALRDGLRLNHGQIPVMPREQFVEIALGKLFGAGAPSQTTSVAPASKTSAAPASKATSAAPASKTILAAPASKATSAAPAPKTTSAAHAPTGLGIKSDVLLRAAQPDLFRLNAFRVTGLPVDATAQQISRQVERLRMAEKFGGGTARLQGALALDPPPDAELIRTAFQRLHDPETRLVDEFFWFWPHDLDDPHDEALSALNQGNMSRAAQIWVQMEGQQSVSNVSMHNLAVLAHLQALDWEQGPRGAALSAPELGRQSEMWKSAFRRWKVLLGDEAFWSRLTARIQKLDDPRLTTGTSRRMRESLPLALLSINAQLALRVAQSADVSEAKRQLAVMEESGFDANVARDALHRVIEPLRERVKTMCQAAKQDTSADAAQGAAAIRRLLEQSKPVLAAIDCLLPSGDPLRDGAHDEIALQSLSGQVAFGNKTEDWRTSVELLEQVLLVAVSASARARIDENLRIVRGNKKLNTCFFCENQPLEESASIKVKVHGNVKTFPVGYNTTRTTWNHRTITVPRCNRCADAHSRRSKTQGLGFLATALSLAAYLLTLIVISDLVSEGPALFAYLAGVAATLVIPGMMAGAIGWLRLQGLVQGPSLAAKAPTSSPLNLTSGSQGVKPENSKFAFPALQERKSEGWKLGEDPPGTEIPNPGTPHQPLLSKWGLLRRQILAGRNIYIRVWVPIFLVLLLVPVLTGVLRGGAGATSFLLQMNLISPNGAFARLNEELDGPNDSAFAAFTAMRQLLHASGVDSTTTVVTPSGTSKTVGELQGSEIDAATAVTVLTKALGNGDARVSTGAAEELGKMGPRARAATGALAKTALDKRENVSAAAAEALNHVDPEGATRAAIEGLASSSAQVRRQAAARLAAIGPEAKASAPALQDRLRDTDAEVRNMASVALAKVAPDMIVPRLIIQLRHNFWQVRQKAAQELGNLGAHAKAAVPALRAATRDTDADVRRAATEALRKVGEPGVKQATAQMNDSNAPVQADKASRAQSVTAQLAKAQQLWRDGHPEEALKACDAALMLDPNNGKAASLRQKYAKAIAILNGGKQ